MSLADDFERQLRTPSDIREHLGTMAALCIALDAKTVIELGVRRGISTVAWLFGLEHTHGFLWSVDIADPLIDTVSDQQDLFRWTFTKGDDRDPSVLAELPPVTDIVFIDTTHAYQHTLDELLLYAPRVRPGGRVVLHDTEVETPDGVFDGILFPVRHAIEDYCRLSGATWSNQPNNNGLGIIEVPK